MIPTYPKNRLSLSIFPKMQQVRRHIYVIETYQGMVVNSANELYTVEAVDPDPEATQFTQKPQPFSSEIPKEKVPRFSSYEQALGRLLSYGFKNLAEAAKKNRCVELHVDRVWVEVKPNYDNKPLQETTEIPDALWARMTDARRRQGQIRRGAHARGQIRRNRDITLADRRRISIMYDPFLVQSLNQA